jgi:uncharacterized protein
VIGFKIIAPGPIIDNSVGVWFMQDDPELQAYERYNKEIGEKEWSLLQLETASIHDPVFLRELSAMTERISKLSHIAKVLSLTNVRDSKGLEDGSLEYNRLYSASDTTALLNADQLSEFKQALNANPIFEGTIFKAADDQHTMILFQNDNLLRDRNPYRIKMVDSIKAIVQDYKSLSGFSMAGTTMVNTELNRSAQKDVIKFYVLVTLLVTAFGAFSLRNIRDLAVLLAVVTGSVVPPMGLLAVLGIPYNMVTILLPPILVSLCVCDIIHLINGFHYERKSHPSPLAMEAAMGKIFSACIWTSVVTMAGFLSLAFSTVLPIWQMGIYASLGIFMAWCITMTLAPIMLVRFWPQGNLALSQQASDGSKEPGLYARKFVPILFGRLKPLWLLIFALMFIPLIGISKLKVDTDYTQFFGKNADLSRSYAKLEETGFSQNVLSLVLRFPEGKTYASEKYFSHIRTFEKRVSELGEVQKILSLTQLVERIDFAFNNEGMPTDSARDRISAYTPAQINQLLFLGELSGNDDIEDFTNKDRTRLQILTLTPYMSSHELQAFRGKIAALAAKVLPPDLSVEVLGTTVLWANMDSQISRTQIASFIALAIVFTVLLPIIFKSFWLGLLGVLINSLPLAMTFGIMGLIDVRINIATALIGGVSIGSTVDSTIFFINRFKQGLQEGLEWDDAIRNALITVGDGIIMTSVILAGGFCCMAISSFQPTAQFGIFTTFTIVSAVYLDLFIDPLLLSLLNFKKKKPARITSATPTDVIQASPN